MRSWRELLSAYRPNATAYAAVLIFVILVTGSWKIADGATPPPVVQVSETSSTDSLKKSQTTIRLLDDTSVDIKETRQHVERTTTTEE